MSNATQISTRLQIVSREKTSFLSFGSFNPIFFTKPSNNLLKKCRILRKAGSSVSLCLEDHSREIDLPISVELEHIENEEGFDRILEEARKIGQSVVVIWTATWCQKFTYLKPHLEKLAAECYPSTRFYSIDVNTVSQSLVTRAGVNKMPTIQLWEDCIKQNQLVGGHKAWVVVNEVREMIEKEG